MTALHWASVYDASDNPAAADIIAALLAAGADADAKTDGGESALPAAEYCAAGTPSTRRERRGDGVWAAPDAIDATSQHAGKLERGGRKV